MKTVTLATILLYALVYLLPLGVRPLVAPDEVRYSEIPREMIQSGDWVVPHLDGLRYFEKPVLGYWAVAGSMLVFGENAFAARLPSALSVAVTVLLVGLLMRRAGAGKTATGLAPVILLTSVGGFMAGIVNVLDGMFSATVTATVVLFYFAYLEPPGRRRILLLAGAGAAAGLAFLVKGFLGPALAVIVVAPFLIWERRARDLLRLAWLPIVAGGVVALPWGIAIAVREPGFWHYFVVVEHLRRFASNSEAQHDEPFWFLLPCLLIAAVPWIMFLASVTIGIRKAGPQGSFVRLLLCWAVLPFIFLSMSRGKLPTYVAPCCPPLAVLAAIGLTNYLESGKAKLFNVGALLVALIAAFGAVFLFLSAKTHWFKVVIFGPSEGWRCALAVAGLATWVVIAILATRVRDHRRKLALFCAGPVLTLLLVPWIFPVEPHQKQMPWAFLQRYGGRVDPAALLVSDRNLVHSVCWSYHRDDVYLMAQRAGELEYGLNYPGCGQRLLDLNGFLKLLETQGGRRKIIVILTGDVRDMCIEYAGARLPPPKFEAREHELWIGEY